MDSAMKKNTVFTLIAVAIPIVFFVSLEVGLRWANYRGDTELFVHPEQFPGYVTTNRSFASRYFFNTTVIPSPNHDFFKIEKPANSFRIFVMGESTTAGYPYPSNGSFPRVTRDALQDVLPDYEVEMINVSMSAINSYTLYDQVREIMEYEPDAILIYTGHNEYYGALGVGSSESLGAFPGFVRFYLSIQRLKTFMLLRDGMGKTTRWFASLFAEDTPARSATLMEQVVKEQIIPLDSPLYELGLRQFESNMRALLGEFKEAGVPVFMGSVASNEREFVPFESVATDQHIPAENAFGKAIIQLMAGDTAAAKQSFTYAKDLDALRFRAPSRINEIIRTLSEEGLATYVPVYETLTEAAVSGIIGYDLMLEHLHPNQKGYHLMGMAYYNTLKESGFVGRTADLSKESTPRDYEYRMALTELDHRIVEHRMMVLTKNWPFVKDGPPFRYNNYKYTSVADSFAFQVVNFNKRWDEAKVELAELYRTTGRLPEAIEEYRGLMRDQPFNDSPFIFAARALLDAGYLDSAEPYLLKAQAIEESAFTTKMLGAIEVNRGNFEKGIDLLTRSLALSPKDPQAKFNLSGAYAQNGNLPKALEIAREIQRESPNFPGIQPWVAQLERFVN
jgi:tetratricopeptide (TPR) repeat protein